MARAFRANLSARLVFLGRLLDGAAALLCHQLSVTSGLVNGPCA
jgi:hypothetical protein